MRGVVEFLAFNILLQTKYEQKVIGNQFCIQKILKNPACLGFKQTFNELLKVIGIQKYISNHIKLTDFPFLCQIKLQLIRITICADWLRNKI